MNIFDIETSRVRSVPAAEAAEAVEDGTALVTALDSAEEQTEPLFLPPFFELAATKAMSIRGDGGRLMRYEVGDVIPVSGAMAKAARVCVRLSLVEARRARLDSRGFLIRLFEGIDREEEYLSAGQVVAMPLERMADAPNGSMLWPPDSDDDSLAWLFRYRPDSIGEYVQLTVLTVEQLIWPDSGLICKPGTRIQVSYEAYRTDPIPGVVLSADLARPYAPKWPILTGGRPAVQSGDALCFLWFYLQAGPRSVPELRALAEEEGIRPVTLRRARDAMGVVTQRFGSPPNQTVSWRLPATEDLKPDQQIAHLIAQLWKNPE